MWDLVTYALASVLPLLAFRLVKGPPITLKELKGLVITWRNLRPVLYAAFAPLYLRHELEKENPDRFMVVLLGAPLVFVAACLVVWFVWLIVAPPTQDLDFFDPVDPKMEQGLPVATSTRLD